MSHPLPSLTPPLVTLGRTAATDQLLSEVQKRHSRGDAVVPAAEALPESSLKRLVMSVKSASKRSKLK